jgi:hypothetical protein
MAEEHEGGPWDWLLCLVLAVLLGARLPDMGEPTTETKIHKFFANPIVQGVGVFLALALAFSGKLSQVGTRVCIVLAACVGIWGLWSHLRSKLIAIVFTIAYIAALLFLAKFLTQSTVAVPPPPFITIKISPSAFPVSVAPRSTLYILPIHPYQVFTDAEGDGHLHEFDNSCGEEHLWPRQAHEPANGYEEVRRVEVTNHSQSAVESGRIAFSVLYNEAFGGGCMARPASSAPQEDVIFIPALDPGKSFDFVAVNQTNRCAWLLAPTTIRIRVAGDEAPVNAPLKLEPTVVSTWVSSPFGPTTTKWVGVPIKNPGYGIARSGALCRQNILDKLGNEVLDGAKLQNEFRDNLCNNVGDEHKIEMQIVHWHNSIEDYLGQELGRVWLARFRNQTKPPSSWPCAFDRRYRNAYVVWNGLSSDLDRLNEFMKDPEIGK